MSVSYTFAQSVYNDLPPLFAVVVDEDGFEYVWAKDVPEPLLTAEERIALAHPQGAPDDLDIDDYKSLAFFSVGGYRATEWIDANNASTAIKDINKQLNDPRYLERRAAIGGGAAREIQNQVERTVQDMQFYTDDFDDEPLNADQMAAFVLGAVGGASEDGPNGWLVRSMLGKEPLPGDENGFVTFDKNAPNPAPSTVEEVEEDE